MFLYEIILIFLRKKKYIFEKYYKNSYFNIWWMSKFYIISNMYNTTIYYIWIAKPHLHIANKKKFNLDLQSHPSPQDTLAQRMKCPICGNSHGASLRTTAF